MIDMPKIYVRGLPEEEQDAAHSLGMCLMQLSSTCLEFEAAVELFSQSSTWEENIPDKDERLIVRQWPFIAARVGALCLYDFWMSTQAVNGNLLKRCPSITDMIGQEPKKKAQARLREAFPDLEALRNAAAHPGEINSTPEKHGLNKLPASATFPFGSGLGTVAISGSLHFDNYVFTFKGARVSYSVNQQSADALKEITSLWRDAFLPVEAGTKALPYDHAERLRRAQAMAAPPHRP